MTTQNINADGIARFFQAIIGGGGGNTSALIEADLARRKGLGLDATAANTAADTAFTTGPKTANMNAQTRSEQARALGLNADAVYTAGPQTNLTNAQIASELVRALGIVADTAYTSGAQTNLTNAQTGAETALAGSRNADTRQTDTETSGIAAEQEAQLAIAEIMASPEFNSPYPKVHGPARQRIAAIANLYAGGLTPEIVSGVLAGDAYGNGDRLDPQGFSSALLGTGAVADSGATPQGAYLARQQATSENKAAAEAEADRLAMTIAGNQTNNTADNDAALVLEMLNFTQPVPPGTRYAHPGGDGGRHPLAVTPSVLNSIREEVELRINQKFPDAILSPELRQEVTDAAAKAYSTGRNVADAINLILAELSSEPLDPDGPFNKGNYVVRTPNIPGLASPAQAPAASSGANALAGAIVGAPPAPASAPIPQIAPTIANANAMVKIPAGAVRGKNLKGEDMWQDPTSGKWRYP